jgi:hypothetical protein
MVGTDRGVIGVQVAGRLVAMGEVNTGLLQHSIAVSTATASKLLDLIPGERVRRSERPIAHVRSPELLVGIDCPLPESSGAKVRAVGTAVSRAAITGGHVLQGSAYVRVVRSQGERREAWSHYLSLPGVVETIGRIDGQRLADGFLRGPSEGQLDLGAIGRWAMDLVQDQTLIDHRSAFRSKRTRLRWVITTAGTAGPSATFSVKNDITRTIRLALDDSDIQPQIELCEDLALHDWLLTTLLSLIDRSRIGSGRRTEVVDRLRPAIDFLLPLWMPGARTDQTLAQLWQALDHRPGLSRQWQVNVDRVRDQLSLGIIERLGGG